MGERAPLDEPPCGYRKERCSDSDNRLRDSQIAAGVLGCIFLAAVITTLFVYRKWKVEQEIAGLVWKIDPKDIISMSSQTADGFMDKSTSKVNRIPPFFFKLNHCCCCCCWTRESFMLCPVDRNSVLAIYRNSYTEPNHLFQAFIFHGALNELVFFLVIIFPPSIKKGPNDSLKIWVGCCGFPGFEATSTTASAPDFDVTAT